MRELMLVPIDIILELLVFFCTGSLLMRVLRMKAETTMAVFMGYLLYFVVFEAVAVPMTLKWVSLTHFAWFWAAVMAAAVFAGGIFLHRQWFRQTGKIGEVFGNHSWLLLLTAGVILLQCMMVAMYQDCLLYTSCSDEHEWFQKAVQDPEGKYGNFFYIEDKKDDRTPCNWRSYFGGSVWEELPGHSDKQYLHLFHKKQPDLNWENPEVREEVFKNIRWWMEKGLGGFRIDAIINIKKKLPFQDYPADRSDGMCSVERMLEDADGIGKFLGEMAEKCFHPYDAFTVGEVFNEKEDEICDFIGENGYFSSMFDFEETCYGKSEDGWYASKYLSLIHI